MKTSNSQLPPIHQVDYNKKMEIELKVTRKELESTKQALKVQAARCRHLVTAFTRKLAERDAELKACRQQREKQLSGLLRALLVLEARLRREQKSIKELLAEKDNFINNQKLEIERLQFEVKRNVVATDASQVVANSEMTVMVELPQETINELARVEVYAKPDLISSLGIPDGGKDCGPDSLSSDSTRSCLGDDSDYTVIAAPQVKGVLNVHDRSAFSPISKIKSDRRLVFSPFSRSAPDISKGVPQDEMKPSTLLQKIRIGEGAEKYLDNPVLHCVNQILLKDQEDFLEEQRSHRGDTGGEVIRARDWLDEEESPIEGDIPEDCNQPTPVLEVALQIPKKSVSLTELDQDKMAARLNPPLPPKPKISAVNKKVEFAPNVEFHSPALPVVTPSMPIDTQQFDLSMSILEPLDQGQDKDLYVISNSALDDDIVKQLRGRTLNVSGLHIKPQRINNDRNQHSNVPTGLLHPNHNSRPKSPSPSPAYDSNVLFTPPRTPPQSKVLKVNIQESPKRSGFGFMSPPKVGMPNMIKVASPVATLLTSGEADQAGAKEDTSPSVSQMVRRFEDLGHKKDDDSAKDDSQSVSSTESSPVRLSKDGSPNSTSSSSVSYDTFLEATGLSQKSIITPSRMMTNHRNVTRPKDVKLRNKVKTAGVIERCIPPQVVGPTVKYWTEPFL